MREVTVCYKCASDKFCTSEDKELLSNPADVTIVLPIWKITMADLS